jgi:hypothetical protein
LKNEEVVRITVDANDDDLMALQRIIFETFGKSGLRKDNLLQFNDFGCS